MSTEEHNKERANAYQTFINARAALLQAEDKMVGAALVARDANRKLAQSNATGISSVALSADLMEALATHKAMRERRDFALERYERARDAWEEA